MPRAQASTASLSAGVITEHSAWALDFSCRASCIQAKETQQDVALGLTHTRCWVHLR